MPTARTRPRPRPTGRIPTRNPGSRTGTRSVIHMPSRLSRRKEPPPSLASKVGNGAMAGLLRTGGAARENKSKVAMLAGLGAAGAALLKQRQSSSGASEAPDSAAHTPPETNAFADEKAKATAATPETNAGPSTAA